jgi:polyphenol oxidase
VTDVARRPPCLRVPGWEAIPNLVHGFCGRRGGASDGGFAELNLSFRVGDEADAVHENWRRVTPMVEGLQFVTMTQVHGTHVVALQQDTTAIGEADAMVTRRSGAALSVLTADCVPILLVAPDDHVVAAVHAGWRGTLGGIVVRAVLHLERLFGVNPANVYAALGPAIGGCCYEVGGSIVADLEQRWGSMPGAIRHESGRKPLLDLRSVNTALLTRVGVPAARVASLGPCTRCAAADYFSHRAAMRTVDRVTGRQLSFIGWRA